MFGRYSGLTKLRLARIIAARIRVMSSLSSSPAAPSAPAQLTVLVTGANGKQGRAVCEGLLALHAADHGGRRPLQIRAMVRDASSAQSQSLLALPQRYGAQQQHSSVVLTQADMTDSASLSRALAPASSGGAGAVDAVFLNTVPTFTDAREEVRRAAAVLAAARAAGSVRHVVYSSVVGLADPETLDRVGGLPEWARDEVVGKSVAASLTPADLPAAEKARVRSGLLRDRENKIPSDGQGRKLLQGYFGAKAQIEYMTKNWSQALESTTAGGSDGDRAWTILRPGWFMDNFLPPGLSNYWPELAGARPVVRSATSPKARIMLVDPADIGLVAARAILTVAGSGVGAVATTLPSLANKAINVGSQALTVEQAAAVLSAAAGVHIPAEHVPEREAADEIRAGNLQRDVQAWNTETQDCFEPADLAQIIGRNPTTFEHFLAGRQAQLQAYFNR